MGVGFITAPGWLHEEQNTRRRRGSQLAMRLEETGALQAVDLESWVEP